MNVSTGVAATAPTRSRSLSTSLAGVVCAALLVAKLMLIWRININWDEFYFLSHVYALTRNELSQPFQTAYTYLFTWLPRLGNDEIKQILAARIVMFVLMTISVALMWKLASRWVSQQAAVFAPLCYLAASPVLRHGASFRADSLLTPLILATLLLLTIRPSSRKLDCLAGICAGVAFTITIKIVLIGPLLLAAVLLEPARTAGRSWQQRPKKAIGRIVWFGAVAACTASLLMLAFWFALPNIPQQSVGDFVAHTSSKTLLDSPFVPQLASLQATLNSDWLIWGLMCGGLVIALLRRNFLAAACGLSLLPIVFYRNSFPYYYIVMLAPAVVLAAESVDGTMRALHGRASETIAGLVPMGLFCSISLIAAVNLRPLMNDDIERQQSVVSAIHEIFPTAVPYIDHSGMISSFRKVNFFMSSWGIENYRAAGKPFMREAIERHRPPLLLANRAILEPGTLDFRALLPEDRRLITESYIQYWGPIYVAGTQLSLSAGQPATARLPFAGSYRLESTWPVNIDGISRNPGDVVEVNDAKLTLTMRAESYLLRENEVRLVWSGAAPSPQRDPPTRSMYIGL